MDLTLGSDYFIYEHTEQGHLVAINTNDLKEMKKYWKLNKGKNPLPPDKIKGFPMIHDEEQDSLKIDFTKEFEYEIRVLNKFD
jgi:hypothetical protein